MHLRKSSKKKIIMRKNNGCVLHFSSRRVDAAAQHRHPGPGWIDLGRQRIFCFIKKLSNNHS